MTSETITKRQLQVLNSMKMAESVGAVNWSGTPASVRKVLCEKGLALNVSRQGPDYHCQWATYRLTELGQNVLMGEQFDRGLALGFVRECEYLEVGLARAHEQALLADAEWEIEHGRQYRENSTIEADVRAVLWKHVAVLTDEPAPQ